MSLQEMLETIPKLPFADRQQLIRRAIEADEDLTAHEESVIEARLKDFHPDPSSGVAAESLKAEVMQRLRPQ
ncbi:MAG: hypothetical protein ABI946_08700 [Chthoniobacterales bacterium]